MADIKICDVCGTGLGEVWFRKKNHLSIKIDTYLPGDSRAGVFCSIECSKKWLDSHKSFIQSLKKRLGLK